MKKLWVVFLLLFLSGCYGTNRGFDRAMELRTGLLNGNGCAFQTEITADFGDKTYTFSLDCQANTTGDLRFTVQEPEYLQGISGAVQQGTGQLTFEENALAFPLLGDGSLSPAGGPWVLVKALRSGYVRHCGEEKGLFCMTIDDSYENDALTLEIWVDGENGPVQAEIYQENRRIMTLCIQNFSLL